MWLIQILLPRLHTGPGGRSSFGALIVGYYDQGKLRYASKVGSGFSNLQMRQITDKAKPLRQADCPLDHVPGGGGTGWGYGLTRAEKETATWLKPVLVWGQIAIVDPFLGVFARGPN